MGEEKCENRGTEREVDQVSRQAVCHLLDRCARMLGLLYGLNDLAECCFFSEPIGADLKAACLVDGAREYFFACGLLARHRLAGNRSLFHKGVTADHLAIDGNSAARSNDNNLTGENSLGRNFDNLSFPQNAGHLRQKIQHVLNGAPPSADCQPLQNLGSQHKCGNDQSRKELADGQSG